MHGARGQFVTPLPRTSTGRTATAIPVAMLVSADVAVSTTGMKGVTIAHGLPTVPTSVQLTIQTGTPTPTAVFSTPVWTAATATHITAYLGVAQAGQLGEVARLVAWVC